MNLIISICVVLYILIAIGIFIHIVKHSSAHSSGISILFASIFWIAVIPIKLMLDGIDYGY